MKTTIKLTPYKWITVEPNRAGVLSFALENAAEVAWSPLQEAA